jgi:hypothetical protein
MLCLSRFAFLPLLGGILLSGVAHAQSPVLATQTAMIQADGPKQGPTAERYFNVEGKSHDKYKDYGVLRFETKALKAELDKKFGSGKYKITGVALHMTQSNAAFTKDGSVEFYFSADDKTDIKTPASPLKYPYDPKASLLHGEPLGKATFTKPATKADPAAAIAGNYDLFQGQPGQKALIAALSQGKPVTLVVAEADPGVAATWSAKAVTLTIKAAK